MEDIKDELYDAADIKQDLGEPKWYVLHTISGYENVAKQNLELTIEKFNLQNRIFDIVIPVEEKIVEKKNKKVIVQEKLMPTYLFVKMIYGDDIWHAITRTRGITGFVGPKGRPLPLTSEEIEKSKLEEREADLTIQVGDKVEILDGALVSNIGTVESVDIDTKKCKVLVELFDIENSIELNLNQLRKVNLSQI